MIIEIEKLVSEIITVLIVGNQVILLEIASNQKNSIVDHQENSVMIVVEMEVLMVETIEMIEIEILNLIKNAITVTE